MVQLIYTEGDTIALTILNIILEFKAHNYDDIFLYFPDSKSNFVSFTIDNLIFSHHIRLDEVNGIQRLYPFTLYDEYCEKEEMRLAKSLVVFRHLLQSKDDNGKYIYLNHIEYYTAASFPNCIVFKYKSQTIYIIEADSNDYPNFNILMNELDKQDGLQPNEARIIVTNNSDNLEKLSVNNVINVVSVDTSNNITFLI